MPTKNISDERLENYAKGSNCDRKSQFSEILTEALNPRYHDNIIIYYLSGQEIFFLFRGSFLAISQFSQKQFYLRTFVYLICPSFIFSFTFLNLTINVFHFEQFCSFVLLVYFQCTFFLYFNNFCSGASLARTNQEGVQPWRQINSFPSSPSLINSLTPSHLFLKTPSPIAPSLLFKSLYDAEKFPQFRAIL